MKIDPCNEDLATICGSIAILLLSEFLLLLIWSWKLFFVVCVSITNMCLAVFFAMDIIYFGRRIRLSYEGCTFSFLGRQRLIAWGDMTVYILENSSVCFYDAEASSVGILLCPKNKKYRTAIAPMTFCRYSCPHSGVYIRFCSGETTIKTAKLIYNGYSAYESELLEFFDLNGIIINSP